MPAMTAREAEALREKNGYGMIRITEGAGKGYAAVWATAWPPPERMLLIVPQVYPSTMIELPEEPEQLAALREGVAHGWAVYEMHREQFSKISDDDAKRMGHVVRVAEYRQGEAFQP